MAVLEFQWTNSLDKVFLRREYHASDYRMATALQGEVFSVQLAYKAEFLLNPMEIAIDSPLAGCARVRQVYSMPADCFGEEQDDYIIDNTPGLYPDLLSSNQVYRSAPGVWHSVWVTLKLPENTVPGEYPLKLKFSHRNHYRKERNFDIESPEFTLQVLPVVLPEPDVKVTQWFYGDCLYRIYKVEPWSEEFFRIAGNYFRNMREHNINMIYTPLFTPPLDTHVNFERPTFQSVQVFLNSDGSWHFDFSNLERYLTLADECGMEYFEFSHLFTQWGAEFTPKIMITTANGEYKRIFGWDVRADDERYQSFLAALLPELSRFLAEHDWNKRSYFHISDEPYEENLESYRRASELFHRNLPGCRFIDALSRPEFFKNGLVDIPVPANNHIDAFADLELPERWTYYCVSQWDKVPNQFAHLPSARNRILGLLLYVYDLKGFLHWGFNFWFGQLSTFEINPYQDICSGRGFPPGDAFKVYPGADGMPEDSIRNEVFKEGMQDLAALQLLEKTIGREAVLDFVRKACGGTLPRMDDYPRGEKFLLDFRQELNKLLSGC